MRRGDFAIQPDQAPVVWLLPQPDKLYFTSQVVQGDHKKKDLRVPLPTMAFREFGDHLVDQTTSRIGTDVVGYEANITRKRVRSFPFKI